MVEGVTINDFLFKKIFFLHINNVTMTVCVEKQIRMRNCVCFVFKINIKVCLKYREVLFYNLS